MHALLASAIVLSVPVLTGPVPKPSLRYQYGRPWRGQSTHRRKLVAEVCVPGVFGQLQQLCWLALLIGQPALAFELFGIKFFERKNAEDSDEVIGEPQHYTVDFQVPDGDSDTVDALEGASTLWKDSDKPASGASGLIAKARGDYRRLLATLYSQARYGGTISILIDGREAADLPPDAQLADPASVRVTIDPGPLFHFGRAEIVNQAPPPTDSDDEVDRPERKGFASGELARSGVVLLAERLSVEAWRQQGHAKAEVIERRVEAAHDSDTLDATLVVEPGPRAAYGPTSVQGTDRMDPAFVAYMADLPVGQEFDPDDIKRANTRLARLDVFRAQRIEEGAAIGADGQLPISVIVQERLPRRFGIGGSYSTLDGAGIEAYWVHRNLFGKAERLRFDAKVAGIGSDVGDGGTFDPDDLTYRVGVTFIKPGIYTPDTDFIASLFGEREVVDPYTKTSMTAQAGFNHLFSEKLSARLFLNASKASFRRRFRAPRFHHRRRARRPDLRQPRQSRRCDGRLFPGWPGRALLRIQLRQCGRAHDCGRPHLLRLRRGEPRLSRPAG